MNRRSNGLMALSSAAVLAVYTAGYVKTRSAADRLTVQVAERRTISPPSPGASQSDSPRAEISAAIQRASALKAVAKRSTSAGAGAIVPEPPSDAAPTSQAATNSTPIPATGVPTPEDDPLVVEPSAIVAEPASTPLQQGQYKDGTYLGWGYSRHGDIQASVVVEGGRIVAADIAQCRTRYSCSWVEHLPQQILNRQEARVDFVSGATQSSYAFEDAVAEALSQAK